MKWIVLGWGSVRKEGEGGLCRLCVSMSGLYLLEQKGCLGSIDNGGNIDVTLFI